MNKILSLKVLALLVAPSFFLLPPQALAAGGSVHKSVPQASSISGHPDPGSSPCFLKQLNLNKEQQQKVEKIISEGHRDGHVLKEQLRAKRRALIQYLQTADANQTQALSLNTEINTLQRQLGELRLKTFFSMRAQFSAEQIQKLQHLQKSHRFEPGGYRCHEMEDKPDGSQIHQPNR